LTCGMRQWKVSHAGLQFWVSIIGGWQKKDGYRVKLPNKSFKRTKQLAFVSTSLILTNYFIASNGVLNT
ncbi:hypothetical protein, partial [Pseudoalteromonas tetraodonis]|uniref:hypothetical protein n=1 Tax=Pseudoalteromonas tetraodonis TaxID=43659 RepID=UPI0030038C63